MAERSDGEFIKNDEELEENPEIEALNAETQMTEDEKLHPSCSGTGRISRSFHLKHLAELSNIANRM